MQRATNFRNGWDSPAGKIGMTGHVAKQVYEKHCVFQKFLVKLGVLPDVAEQDACKMEHVISDECFEKLKDIL